MSAFGRSRVQAVWREVLAMLNYSEAAVERAMKVQEVILHAALKRLV